MFQFQFQLVFFLFFSYQFQLSYSYFSVSITVIYFSVTVLFTVISQAIVRRHCLASKHYGHYLVRLIEGKHWHTERHYHTNRQSHSVQSILCNVQL